MNQSQEGYRVAKLEAERDALRAVNAELVEALTKLFSIGDRLVSDVYGGEFVHEARAALAKAKELKGTE